ncbi:EscU/YscU/HrcU family type III secretion system export apparatus switch protein [Nevskia soli]|uniref:EscU/YscU/HrcU family type III secretion system export apparatus switch protein n=1 Tax=Nevskia soli TaxID=418856 RepID=UPI0004A6FA91|nr:flagellar type III secretion system protein FlhB [Nevskia soli]
MADESSDQDRGEPATPFKLEEARKKGSVAKSSEVVSTVSVLAGILAITAFGKWSIERTLNEAANLFRFSGQLNLDLPRTIFLLGHIARDAAFTLSPILVLVVLGGLLGNLLQTGPVFSTTPLTPDFQRLNPAAGLKRLVSKKMLFDFFKVCLKLGVFLTLAFFILRGVLPGLSALYLVGPRSNAANLGHQAIRTVTILGFGAILIALLDLLYTRWDFARRMSMSRKDLKDETKRREGDPRIRERRRALMREMRRRSAAVGNVKEADVLITNPEHYAVAVKYRRGKAVAPEVVAKGAGQLAQKLREAAFRHRIPVVPNPRLARALYREVRIGRPIPEEHYAAVADVLRWVYQIRQRQAAPKNQS